MKPPSLVQTSSTADSRIADPAAVWSDEDWAAAAAPRDLLSAAILTPPRARPHLQHLASGGQAHVFTLPHARWVIKVPRISLLSVAALYLRFPGHLHRVQANLGGLALPFTTLRKVQFTGAKLRGVWDTAQAVSGSTHRYRAGQVLITHRIDRRDFLDETLERGSATEVADGLDSLLALLERLSRRGFLMVDFVMKNFAWHQGELLIADVDLIIPLGWVRHPHFAPAVRCFRRGLLRDYDRIIRNALARSSSDDAGTRKRLEHLRTDFRARINALFPKRGQSTLAGDPPQPVTFSDDIAREVAGLLG